ncbi:MAG: FAD-dependent oxidoreductase [Pseudomonadota bacterium]
MSRDPRFDILFEPVRIGPVTARNRFYQVPHCNGMGRTYPSSMAEMRGVKAEGGWAVVCTEEVEIHHTAEYSPGIEGRLWADEDIPVFARMTEKIHEHGSLAGIELGYASVAAPNRYSREIPIAPGNRPVEGYDPLQARAMDAEDIRAVRKWHIDAAHRAKRAGFDVIYVYCGHDLAIQMHFLSRTRNTRTDEYGGSLENRVRLFREILYETKDAVGDTCAVAVRFAVDELKGSDGIEWESEGRDIVEMFAEVPDLWDVNVSDWHNDSVTSRFAEAGYQEPYISFVKSMTSKPVVGVGRYTSPDTMVSLVKRGVMDFIGAARPSIADPFLPKKIEEGRIDDIRECIGCNVCVSGDYTATPIRCTQNPTMGEEWRKGWHPDRIPRKASDENVLIVGAGPAGLECALALGQRGYSVTLAEAGKEVGGRVSRECALPGLGEWGRVRDYRQYQLARLANVDVYLESRLSAGEALEFGADHIVIATGSEWRADGVGRANETPVPGWDTANCVTPDDIMDGTSLGGPVLIYDDDHFYMGGVLAEKLRAEGLPVILVTPAADVSHWTHNTLEQERIQTRLIEMDVEIVPLHQLANVANGQAELACVYTGRTLKKRYETTVMVTSRAPNDLLWQEIKQRLEDEGVGGLKSVTRIGDCLAPGTIAAAVYGGHRYARELNAPRAEGVPFRRELIRLSEG